MVNRQENGLKGQYILAQGFALGLMPDEKIVRAMKLFKKISLFRTKRHEFQCLPDNNGLQFRPKEFFCPDYHVCADDFVVFPLPRALPWAELC